LYNKYILKTFLPVIQNPKSIPMRRSLLVTVLCLVISNASSAAVFTVTSTSDNANTSGSLRWAITQANATTAADVINFNLASPYTINVPTTSLPAITQPLTINGFSQSTSAQGPLGAGTRAIKVLLTGPGNNAVYGLQITGNNVEVCGIVFQNFYKAIYINGGDNNWIWGCYIGTSLNGNSISASTTCYDDGIALNNNANNNIIGTNGDGTNDANEGNLISGNGDFGTQYLGESIAINEGGTLSTDCTGTRIAGNFLGTNETGNAALYYNPDANKQRGTGIHITRSTYTVIGTNADGVSDTYERNIISGNSDKGIGLNESSYTKIKGNYIGTDKTGLVGIPNYTDGGTNIATGQIALTNNSNNNIIGTDGDGVNDAIEGNVIGSATISGTANSYSDAIDIITSSINNRIAGNKIGIGSDGVTPLYILTTGVTVIDYAIYLNANNNTVGTNGDGVSDALEANYIGNSGTGVTIEAATGCVVAGNYFGLASNQTTSAALTYAGVYIYNASSNRIGSSASNSLERNYFCNGTRYGVWIDGAATAGTDANNIRYNIIGIRPDGTVAANAWHGVYVYNSSNGNTIQYNTITRNGTGSASGAYSGVQIGGTGTNEHSSSNVIQFNTIYKNIGPGVSISHSSSLTNQITQNSIYDNGNASDATGKFKLGIDLGADGHTANDALDADAGANSLTNYPVITGLAESGSGCTNATMSGTYVGLANTSYYVEVFQSDVCNGDTAGIDYRTDGSNNFGEGKVYMASSAVFTTDASGNGTWSVVIPFASVAGKYFTAVAIQNTGKSTSEFSKCFGAAFDYGDAPNSYGTTLSSCGARHYNANSDLRIGSTIDTEADGNPGVNANGDGSDEDGLTYPLPALHEAATTYSITSIPVTNNTGSAATLYGWIDFDLDGVFESAEVTSVAVPASGSQTVTLSWNVGALTCNTTVKDGDTYLRLRLTTTSLTDDGATSSVDERSTGLAGSGEAEDYMITILPDDFGDLPNTYPVATAIVYSSGTTGKVWGGDTVPDHECATTFSADATGDGSDEDALTMSSGQPGRNYNWVIVLNSNQPAKTVYYGLWIDWNRNGNFTDAFDAFYSGNAVTNGAVNVNRSVYLPYGSASNSGVRLVISTSAVTSTMYNATFENAEVEDYILLNVLEKQPIVLKGRKQSDGNLLSWIQKADAGIQQIIVERSVDNNRWEIVHRVNTSGTISWVDEQPPTACHYRLRIMYVDGSFKFSNSIAITGSNGESAIVIYPNPTSEILYIDAADAKVAEILDLNGQLHIRKELSSNANSVDVKSLPTGTWMVRITKNNNVVTTHKFLKL
jgi:parallel beta-helix repeat protein